MILHIMSATNYGNCGFEICAKKEFVKFITEVQDKNSRIMPLAEMMILRDLMDNRKEQLSVLADTVQKYKAAGVNRY